MDAYGDLIRLKDPAKANQIIKSAKDALCSLLDQEVYDALDEINNAEKQLEDLNFQISMANSKLEEIRQQIKKEEEYDRTNAPKEFLRRIVTQYTGDYAPGDKVFRVKPHYTVEDCPTCHRKKQVTATFNGEEIKVSCPECQGTGTKRTVEYIVDQDIISSVHLKLCFGSESRVGLWNDDCVFVVGSEYKVDPKYLFRDREAAEAIARELNEKNEEQQ